jgi:carboxypeptidase family protein
MLVGACRTFAFLLALAVGVPCGAYAQAIAGLVHDASGVALPEVIVQAESSALIERVRTVVTDGSGQYRIEDLRPGIYTITFVRAGFSPQVREGVQISSAFTASVNARLGPGPVAETITVMAATPAVDVRSAGAATTLRRETVRALPTVRSYNALVVLMPGIVTSANDVVTGTTSTQFPIHGGRSNEGRLALDGVAVGGASSNSPTSYVVDVGVAEEVTFAAAGGMGETDSGGLVMNLVPKTGGNSTHGSVFVSGTGEKLHSDNLTPALKNQGVTAASPLSKVYDVSGTIGGPIARDRLWYFVTAHRGGSTTNSTNVYYNLNAGDPTKWSYAPDSGRIAYSDRLFENASARVTWQMTRRNKVSVFWDEQALCRTCTGATPAGVDPARVSPEAVGVFGRPLRVAQATWSAPLSNRLLVEAGFGNTYFGFGNFERNPNPTRDLIRVVEQCATGCAANGNIPGLAYRSQDFSDAYNASYLWKGSVSYVTGSHSVKVGYQRTLMTQDIIWTTNNQNLTYRFNGGVPNQLTQSISPWMNRSRTEWDAVFAQERWTHGRLTVQAAVRFDRAWSWFPAQQEGPSRFLPAPIIIPETPGVDSYKDITPRLGASYDLFGNGTTALKVHLGRYLEGAGTGGLYTSTNPTLRMPQTTSTLGTAGVTRAWSDANGNFVPDCDLLKPNAQDLRASGGDLCGVMSNTSFGQYVLTNNFDPAILNGWAVRPSDWSLDVSIQRQLLSRASATLAYSRRWFDGFTVADNLALQPSDLMPFSVVAPADPRLPGGGGYVIRGLYDVVPDKAGQVSNLVADSSTYGRWYQYYNGFDATLNMRAGGFTFAGGTSTGQTVADNCEVRAHLPELATTQAGASPFGPGLAGSTVSPISPYCHVAFGVTTQFRGLASYELSGIGAQLSMTLQSKPGAMLTANYAVPNAAVASSLGRNLSGNAPNVTVNLVAPGTRSGDRINQLDVRVAKILRHGRFRTMAALDMYNALNSSAGLTYNDAFVPGASWPRPNTILTPRFFMITVETEF